jgi:hypothetical protein
LLDAMSGRASAYQVEDRLVAVAQLWIETYNDDCLRCHEVDALDCEVMLMSIGRARAGEPARRRGGAQATRGSIDIQEHRNSSVTSGVRSSYPERQRVR